MTDKNEESYLNYLKDLVRNHISNDYHVLLDELWQREYYSVLPNDQNRAKDGIFLRDVLGDVNHDIFGQCRILEMLIALSKRMAYQIDGTGYDEDYVDLFWEFLGNLDLLKFNDSVMLGAGHSVVEELDSILTNFLERRYLSNGVGSIFPIKGWKRGLYKAQHKIEVWYQMMAYLAENYPF